VRRRSGRLPVLSALLVALALVAAACTGDDDTAATPSTTTTAAPLEAGYQVPPTHPSDWAAAPVPLPDAPRPYGPSPAATADPAFYDVATLDPVQVADAAPGDVLRAESVELTGPLDGASGWRILYRSTGSDGSPAVVSGMVLAPIEPAPGGGHPVAAWAHGTTGIADRCAPSATGNLFYDDYGTQARRLLDQGFVVTATDYHGLGTPGVHGYHVSDQLAAATIDSVAAAHDLDDVGPLAPSWVVVGHSEGGLAALATDQLADKSLPQLDYRGAVVAAPSARLGAIAELMFGAPEGRGYGALLLEAASEIDPGLDPSVSLQPVAAARRPLLTHGCWEEAVPGFDDLEAEQMLAGPEVGARLGAVLDQCCTSDPSAAIGPLLVVHGEADEALPLGLSEQLVDELCAAGVTVQFRTYPGATHDGVLAAAAAEVGSWLTDRLTGSPATSTCGAP
jgi:alpha-beta hydrolase superfamily lysophospholipase